MPSWEAVKLKKVQPAGGGARLAAQSVSRLASPVCSACSRSGGRLN